MLLTLDIPIYRKKGAIYESNNVVCVPIFDRMQKNINPEQSFSVIIVSILINFCDNEIFIFTAIPIYRRYLIYICVALNCSRCNSYILKMAITEYNLALKCLVPCANYEKQLKNFKLIVDLFSNLASSHSSRKRKTPNSK